MVIISEATAYTASTLIHFLSVENKNDMLDADGSSFGENGNIILCLERDTG